MSDYEKVKTASEVIQTEDIRLRILNIEALIESKKAMGREHDKQAILQLETIKKLKSKKLDNR